MTTEAQVIAEVERHVLSGISETRNVLASDATSGAVTLSFSYAPAGVGIGSVISLDLEDTFCLAVDTASKTATVIRGEGGSTAVAHLAAGTTVKVNSRASKWTIHRALNEELRALSSPRKGLFKLATVDLTYASSRRGFDLTSVSDMIGAPIRVAAQLYSNDLDWVPLNRWRYEANLPAADFPSGRALFLDESGVNGRTIRVTYRSGFTELPTNTLTQNVESVSGIPSYALTALQLGAALRVLDGRPNERADIEAQPGRRFDEVTVTDTLRAPAALKERYIEELADAVARLTAENPVRLR